MAPESKRQRPNILITGTPGTGKTTMCTALAEATQLRHINIGDLVREKNLHDGWDAELECHVINEDLVMQSRSFFFCSSTVVMNCLLRIVGFGNVSILAVTVCPKWNLYIEFWNLIHMLILEVLKLYNLNSLHWRIKSCHYFPAWGGTWYLRSTVYLDFVQCKWDLSDD